MTSPVHLACPSCAGINRVPDDRLDEEPVCGRCKAPLFAGKPFELTAANAPAHLERTGIPLLVDFWAAWCGPCRAMAPVLEQAAAALEPGVRIAKLDTEAHPALAQRFQITALPTLALFRGGRELERFQGATSLSKLVAWVRTRLSAGSV